MAIKVLYYFATLPQKRLTGQKDMNTQQTKKENSEKFELTL